MPQSTGPEKLVRRTPGCRVEFLGVDWQVVAQESLISVSTDKSLGQPAGTFQIVLKVSSRVIVRDIVASDLSRSGEADPAAGLGDLAGGANYWLDNLKPATLVRIRMRPELWEVERAPQLSKSKRPKSLTMLGSVDTVGIEKTMGPQGPSRVVVVTGRDLGKLFTDDAHYTFSWPALVSDTDKRGQNALLIGNQDKQTKDNLLRRYFIADKDSFQKDLIINTVGVAIDTIVSKASALDITLADSTNLRQYLPAPWVSKEVSTIPFFGGEGFFQMSGSVWALLEYLVPKPWGEIFVETVGQQARLIVRRPPWGRPYPDQDIALDFVRERLKARRDATSKSSDTAHSDLSSAEEAPRDPEFVHVVTSRFASSEIVGTRAAELNELFDVTEHLDDAVRSETTALGKLNGPLWDHEEFDTPTGVTRLEGRAYHKITEKEILSLVVGRNDREVLNVYFPFPSSTWLQGDGDPMQAGGILPPIIDVSSVLKYGLRLFQTENRWWFSKSQPDGLDFLTELLLDTIRAYFYFRDNAKYLSGTITIMGKDEIRIGDHVVVNDFSTSDPTLFYVEGVANNWEFGNTFTTTLRVTRGQPLKLTRVAVGQTSPVKP